MIFKHAAVQLGLIILLLSLFGATDTWYLVTGFGLANALNIVVAAVAGAITTTLVHEWFHFLGARLAGASYSVPTALGLFVYDFDYQANSLRQFNVMSVSGQLGSWLTVLALWSALPMDTPGRVMLVSGAVTSALFAGFVELPVLRRAQRSGDPLAELSKIDQKVLARSGFTALVGGFLMWSLAG